MNEHEQHQLTYGELAEHAHDIVLSTMFDGDIRGKRGWKQCSVTYHMMRAGLHNTKYLAGEFDEDHMAHELTRTAIASYLLKYGSKILLRRDEFASDIGAGMKSSEVPKE